MPKKKSKQSKKDIDEEGTNVTPEDTTKTTDLDEDDIEKFEEKLSLKEDHMADRKIPIILKIYTYIFSF